MRILYCNFICALLAVLFQFIASLGYCADQPSEKLRAGFANVKVIAVKFKRDAKKEPYQRVTKQILTTLGYEVVEENAKKKDA